MKKLYIAFIIILNSLLLQAQTPIFTDTKGELSITNSGQATYNLPIAMPPSIKNVAPVINLTYSSGQRGGIAGQGWSINSISSISRMSTRIDIDGFRDGVDFDDNDKLALDGQRLILKSGTYWAHGSTYETEYKSNTRIELQISGTNTFFIVTSPDGSQTWYGSTGSGVSQNATSLNAWFIVRFRDVYGNYITYNYTNHTYNGTNQLYINNIQFSGNEGQGLAQLNKIQFNYRATNAARVEMDYMKGQAVYAFKILDNIQVLTNNVQFRKYQLTQVADDCGYERVTKVQEFNGLNEPSNPVLFGYEASIIDSCNNGYNLCPITKTYTTQFGFDGIQLSGDFDGDGQTDFVADNKLFTKFFDGGNSNNYNQLYGSLAYAKSRQLLSVSTLSSNVLNQMSSLIYVEEAPSASYFKIYNLSNLTNNFELNRTIYVPMYNHRQYMPNLNVSRNVDFCGIHVPTGSCDLNQLRDSNEYIQGDFNGDGISEVLTYRYHNEISYKEETNYLCYGNYHGTACRLKINSSNRECFYLDLNPILDTPDFFDNGGFVYMPDLNLQGDNKYVNDFNGDGKADILVITGNNYKLLSLNNDSGNITFQILGQGTIPYYSSTRQILFGDYNGDGKTDFMYPHGANSDWWSICYANPKINNLDFFNVFNFQSVQYKEHEEGTRSNDMTKYYAMDINKDGKSDLVTVQLNERKRESSLNNWDSTWQVIGYTNNIGKGNQIFTQTYTAFREWSDNPARPIVLVTNYQHAGQNQDLVIVNNYDNYIQYYKFKRDFSTENRLKTVTESSGNIVQTIDYAPMVASDGNLGTVNDFYSSTNTATYPNIEIIKNKDSFLVSKLTATINGVSKFQDFKYRSQISSFEYGGIGFLRTARSSWYTNTLNNKIWTIQEIDPSKRGATINTWSASNGSNVFATIPTNLLSSKNSDFETYTNPITKQYNVLLKKQTSTDHLTNVINETTYSYDGTIDSATAFGLQLQTVNKSFLGTTLQGTSTTTTSYENNASGVGNAYFIGKPKTVDNTNIIYPNEPSKTDTRTSKEIYSYDGPKIFKIEKRGHNTTNAIFEDMTYDNFGNLLTKTISCPTAVPALASRTTTDEYDPLTKRFVIKKIDHQGFQTLMQYNNAGQVTKSTSYLGVVNDFVFDNWGKLTTSTTTGAAVNALINTTAYLKLTHGGYKTTNTNNVDAAVNSTEYNVLGNVVKSTTKGFAVGTTISKSIEYDALGRKSKEYEPYFTALGKFTAYTYDYLSRPKTVTASTGRLQTLSYSGLTTTSQDDTKTTTATIDALGNKVTTTDEGGMINFKYYANGQLKETDYDGHKITIGIDGWGNKTSMTDPNAGIYTYVTDEFGQAKTETTPKGATNYVYDNFGKLITKRVLGDGADYVTTYTYNAFAQLTNEVAKKANNTNIDNFVYRYDTLKRLDKTTETNTSFVHSKTIAFDNFGRPLTETTLTTDTPSALSATVISKNHYNAYNGMMDKMTDNNNVVLWQLTGANEKMQALTANLGNGVAITNTYDADKYFASQRHIKNGVDILYNNYSFDAIKGNLNSRKNNAIGAVSENFEFDNLDRLICTNTPGINLLNLNFSTINNVEGFVDSPDPQAQYSLSIANTNGLLDLAFQNGTVEKLLTSNTIAGKKYKVSCDINLSNFDDRQCRYTIQTVGKNPITNEIELLAFSAAPNGQTGLISFEYETGNFSEVYFQIYVEGQLIMNLDNFKLQEINQDAQSYDERGRIDYNNVGTYNYTNAATAGMYRKTSVSLSTEGQNYYANKPLQTLTYTMFKAPITINEGSNLGSIRYSYNSHLSRTKMQYGWAAGGAQVLREVAPTYGFTKTKFYTDDGSAEIIKANGKTTIITYIGGTAYSAPLYNEKVKTTATGAVTENKYYLHRDYLGSIIAISNAAGVAIERRHFDAWGNLVKLQQNGVLTPLPLGGDGGGLMVLDRGYTSHEHLAEVSLINMNGRLYDPKLHTFLMPDNFVQQPENTQNYNRYAYVLNNPLRYTDPSGEFIPFLVAVAIGAFIGGATYAATCFFGGQDFSWSGLATSTFIGAMSAAVTFGIGQVAGSMFTQVANQSMQQIARGAMQALMHGTFQGAMASIQGGDFWSAAAAGALSSIASSAFGFDGNGKNADGLGWGSSVRSSSAGMIAFGTLAGGAGASLTGGNFWQGAVTGLVVSGLNHAMHSGDGADDNGYDKNGNKINDNGGDKTDTMYNDDGSVFSTTAVENITADGGFHDSLRGYGYKLNFKMATGAITEDNTIANLFTGGAAAKGVGSLLSSKSASLVLKYSSTLNKGNWWRLGQGFNPSTGLKNIRLAWGAHPNYLQQVPKFLQGINTSLRNFAQGHIHFPNWKP